MGSMNRVTLVGYLGRDAELRYTPGGAAVSTVNMATTEVWNDKDGKRQERTEWHRIQVWGKQAESLTEYLTKGKQILVEGKLQTREWEDKNGVKRWTTEIRSSHILLLGGGGNGNSRRDTPPPTDDDAGNRRSDDTAPAMQPPYDDDIPF